jgi:electron transport complex protein RnfC
VKRAGIIGLGGAGFPTHVKLAPKNADAIEYVIANGAECEPYITCDDQLMRNFADEIVTGMEIILKLFPNAKGVILIENNKPEATASMKRACSGHEKVEVAEVPTKYPQGGERSIISVVTGRHIKLGMLPADAGCIVDNVDTVISIYNAVAKSTPLMRRVFTLTGDAVKSPQNYEVKIGMNLAEVVEANGGFETQPEKIIAGGPMMGMALFDLNIPITKTNSALLCFKKDEVAANPETPCIKCGKCVSVCPSHIVPVKMMAAALKGDCERFEALNGMECMECGSCTYICPAKRPLTQAFKEMRKTVAANRRKKA